MSTHEEGSPAIEHHAETPPPKKPRAPRKAPAKKAARKRAPVKRAAIRNIAAEQVSNEPVVPLAPDVPVIPAGALLGNATTPAAPAAPAAPATSSFHHFSPVSMRLDESMRSGEAFVKREEEKAVSFAQAHPALGWWIALALAALGLVVVAWWAGAAIERRHHASAPVALPAAPAAVTVMTFPPLTVMPQHVDTVRLPALPTRERASRLPQADSRKPATDAPLPVPARVSVDLTVRAPATPALPDVARDLWRDSAKRPSVIGRQRLELYPKPLPVE